MFGDHLANYLQSILLKYQSRMNELEISWCWTPLTFKEKNIDFQNLYYHLGRKLFFSFYLNRHLTKKKKTKLIINSGLA